jgi:hypothetical protein
MSVSASLPAPRELETCLLEVAAVKETILVDVCVNRVSIPSALPADCAGGFDLLATFTGSVNERRMLGLEDTGGACSGVFEAAGKGMVDVPLDHRCRRAVEICVARICVGVSAVVALAGRILDARAWGGWWPSVHAGTCQGLFHSGSAQGTVELTTSA